MSDTLSDRLFQISLHQGRYTDPLALAPSHAQVFSQNGEDGMIAEIFRRIGERDRFFVEIGIGDGSENNTRFLLERGWTGVWIEGSRENAARAREAFKEFIDGGRMTLIDEIVTIHNIEELLRRAAAPAQFDFLSLDIDQSTSHIWRAISARARVACIEYNASIPPSIPCEVPYEPTREWDGTNWFGAGLKTLEMIGATKQMNLVGCDLLGVNAFFVSRSEAEGKFRAPFTAEEHYEPPGYTMTSHLGHRRSPVARTWLEHGNNHVYATDG